MQNITAAYVVDGECKLDTADTVKGSTPVCSIYHVLEVALCKVWLNPVPTHAVHVSDTLRGCSGSHRPYSKIKLATNMCKTDTCHDVGNCGVMFLLSKPSLLHMSNIPSAELHLVE